MGIVYDPHAHDFWRDPYPLYSRLRSEDPIHWESRLGEWILTRHEDVRSGFRDPAIAPIEMSASLRQFEGPQGIHLPAIQSAVNATLFLKTPPGHAAARRYLARVLNGLPLTACRPVVERISRELLDVGVRSGGMDLVEDFADPLPFRFMAHLLGVDPADVPFLMDCCDKIVLTLFQRECLREEYVEMNSRIALALDFIESLIRERRVRPRDDGMTRLIQLSECDDASGVGDRELAAHVYFLFMVGVETTATFFAGALVELMRHPDEASRWRRGEVPTAGAVEELLRFVSPVQVTLRWVREDRELSGVRMAAGSKLAMVIGAANRDESVFVDPERLDLGRQPGPHLSFGEGPHACLGGALARLEASIALPMFLDRGDWHMKRPSENISWMTYEMLRKPESLEVVL